MSDKSSNPFFNPDLSETELSTTGHPSDHPGKDYSGDSDSGKKVGKRRSGSSSPSEPRRPGTNERQAPRRKTPPPGDPQEPVVPGELFLADGDIDINVGLEVTTIRVENVADRPVQIGSHFHFAEVNTGLEFDRDAAWGKRLNVLSGGAMRFEPGAAEEVELVPIRGDRIIYGLRGLCGGKLDDQDR
ncbi:urease subunit beta [Arthrobacter echini]|uniref:urease subunit beta n=1 Tax=Arthrobacter echini TaxID=1529066 RepID=UPI001B3BFD23|nr:urease subunit beta [Arthrobacter echini]